MPSHYREIHHHTAAGFAVHDLTDAVQTVVTGTGVREGTVTVSSLHTTLALTVNENEARLLDDMRHHLLRLMPPDARYRHNDIHLRDCPPDEPENAHAHLLAMLLGHAQTLIIHDGRLALGRWQSLLLVELDGPRERRIAVQVVGE